MEDYIAVLLDEMEEHWVDFMGGEYFLQKAREKEAEEALMDALSESQRDLFLSYEERQNAAAALREDAMTRRAFLLAREIYG